MKCAKKIRIVEDSNRGSDSLVMAFGCEQPKSGYQRPLTSDFLVVVRIEYRNYHYTDDNSNGIRNDRHIYHK